MFGFKKKEKRDKTLWIMGKDVMEIIRSDYESNAAFTLIEFVYQGEHYLMGSSLISLEEEERKENIYFEFQNEAYGDFDAFQEHARIDGVKISELKEPIEIVRAGIVGNDTMLGTPWGETRLAKKALNR